MRNFRRVMIGIDVSSLLALVEAHPELWNSDEVFQAAKGPDNVLYATENMVLRYTDQGPLHMPKRHNRPHFWPEAQKIVFDLMHAVRGEHLGPVVISRMRPGEIIKPHIDQMPPGVLPFVQRYQIPLAASHGVHFICGDEDVVMEPGEAWWFDNQAMHSVVNHSDYDRISLRCDIRPFGGDPWRA